MSSDNPIFVFIQLFIIVYDAASKICYCVCFCTIYYFSYNIYMQSQRLLSELSNCSQINGYASGFGYEGSFSASTSYKNSKKEIQKGETTTMNTVGRAVVYRARLSETAKVSKVR